MVLLRHLNPYPDGYPIQISLLWPWHHYRRWHGFGLSGWVSGRPFQEKTRINLGPIAIWFSGCFCKLCEHRHMDHYAYLLDEEFIPVIHFAGVYDQYCDRCKGP